MAINEEKESLFGEIVQERGLAPAEAVAQCEKRRRLLAARGQELRLGQVMMAQKFITKEQALDVLKEVHLRLGRKPQIGGYEIIKKIGQGAVGVVYLARQITMDRPVALKLLSRKLSQDKDLVKRFQREAHTCAKLNHPNIVGAIDVGEGGGYHYFAMEYIDGETLEEVLENTPVLAEKRALEIAVQVVQGLAHAAEQGITHRDIKPSNIMLCRDGTIKIADMGLAVVVTSQTTADLEETGKAIGTPYYMAPEQAEGKENIDFRADIYALGATLFETLTGRKPFSAENVPAIIAKRLYEDPPDAHEHNADVNPRVAAVVRKMMARVPADRYQDFSTLLRDLKLVAEGKVPSGIAPPKSSAKASAKRLVKKEERPRKKDRAKARKEKKPRSGEKRARGQEKLGQGKEKGRQDKKEKKARKQTGSKVKIRIKWSKLPAHIYVIGGVIAFVAIAALVFALTGLGDLWRPRHPDPAKAEVRWTPPTGEKGTGEKARELWVEARKLRDEYEKQEGKDAPALEKLRQAYREIPRKYPDSAYAARAAKFLAELDEE